MAKRDTRDAEHHLAEAKHHSSLIEHHTKLAKLHSDAGEDEQSDIHSEIAQRHNAEHTRHLGLGEACAADAREMDECAKAADVGDLSKRFNLDDVMPTAATAVIPTDNPMSKIRAVPRIGQPSPVDSHDVPPELERFIKVEEW